jgi:hypothetical protein
MRSELAIPGLLFTALAVTQAPPMGPEFQVNTWSPNSRPGLSPFLRELAELDAIPATVGGRH